MPAKAREWGGNKNSGRARPWQSQNEVGPVGSWILGLFVLVAWGFSLLLRYCVAASLTPRLVAAFDDLLPHEASTIQLRRPSGCEDWSMAILLLQAGR